MTANFVDLNGIRVPFGIGYNSFECRLVYEEKFKCHTTVQAVCLRPLTGAIPGQSMWTKWYWNRIYSKYFDIPLSLSFDLRFLVSHSSITDAILATDSVAKLHFEKGTLKATDIHKYS